VLEALAATDVWLVISPIYFDQISGQLKCCLDRWFSYLKPDYMTNPAPYRLAQGKRSVWGWTQTELKNMYGDVFGFYSGFLKWYAFQDHHLLRAAATSQNEATDVSAEKIVQAQELACKIVGS